MKSEKLKVKSEKFFIFFIFYFTLFIFIGCGYKPSSVYQEKILGNNIKVVVNIDVKNPRETIFLKDAVLDAVYTLLGKNVCDYNCESTMIINPQSSSLEVLDYDKNGYPVLYRSVVNLAVEINDKNGKKRSYSVNGTYDFRIKSQSIVDDETKLNAFKNASINALNKLFALLAKEGISL